MVNLKKCELLNQFVLFYMKIKILKKQVFNYFILMKFYLILFINSPKSFPESE